MRTFPPYRSQVVAEIPVTTRAEREQALAAAGYNAFNLPANKVSIDLLTDSGTGAVSTAQEAAAAAADRSYAGSDSFYRFRDALRELTGYPHLLPVHQGRAAERVLFSSVLESGRISVSNTHFDTTRANVELLGAEAIDLPCAEFGDLDSLEPFKGNIDLDALERLLTGPEGPASARCCSPSPTTAAADSRSRWRIWPRRRSSRVRTGCRFSLTPHGSRRTRGWSSSASRATRTRRRARSPERLSAWSTDVSRA